MKDTEVIVTTFTCEKGFVRTVLEWPDKGYDTIRRKKTAGFLSFYKSETPLFHSSSYYLHSDFPNKIFQLQFNSDSYEEVDYNSVKLVERIPIPIKAIMLC